MNSDIRILIIDDEVAIRNILKVSLESNGYKTASAQTGQAGVKQVQEFHPHLVLLDLGLPDVNGIEVLKSLRGWTRVPIIILTVTDDEPVKVKLLDLGADDYLTKPFGAGELLARVRVALRNRGVVEATPVFISEELKVDLNQKKVWVLENEVKLTGTEYELLSRLVRDHGKVVPQAQLLKEIWGSTAEDQSHYLRIYVNQLRKKIEINPSQPKHILTEAGVGYRLV
jgi:two-component system KDP operon response regulator KdpE